jgi:hypothetical protein
MRILTHELIARSKQTEKLEMERRHVLVWRQWHSSVTEELFRLHFCNRLEDLGKKRNTKSPLRSPGTKTSRLRLRCSHNKVETLGRNPQTLLLSVSTPAIPY